MAQRLLAKGVTIDLFISSNAKRARKTAALFAHEYGVKKDAIVLLPELYHAGPEQFYESIEKTPDTVSNIAVFSHNPGITEFVNELTGIRVDDMPTCAVFAVKTTAATWGDFRKAAKDCWFFDYPKSTRE